MEEDFFIDEEDEEQLQEEDVYSDTWVDEEVNNDGIDGAEGGFMHGFNSEIEL